MINKDDPQTTSLRRGLDTHGINEEQEKVYITNEGMSKPMIAVLRGGSENTFEMIELGEESRKYVHINVINIHERW